MKKPNLKGIAIDYNTAEELGEVEYEQRGDNEIILHADWQTIFNKAKGRNVAIIKLYN